MKNRCRMGEGDFKGISIFPVRSLTPPIVDTACASVQVTVSIWLEACVAALTRAGWPIFVVPESSDFHTVPLLLMQYWHND